MEALDEYSFIFRAQSYTTFLRVKHIYIGLVAFDAKLDFDQSPSEIWVHV